MSEDLDWGPRRPPAVSWAGAVLLLLGLAQLGLIGIALVLESDAFFERRADRAATAGAMGLFGLQVIAAVAVLRLWRWWRGIAMLLALLGLALQVANLAGPPDRPLVVGVNASLAVLYFVVLVLLARSRAAFR